MIYDTKHCGEKFALLASHNKKGNENKNVDSYYLMQIYN